MISNIIYRLSCFADYAQLTYNKKDLIRILDEFDEEKIEPTLFPEVHPNGEVSQRMQFTIQSKDKVITIIIASDRIDVQVDSREKNGFNSELRPEIKKDMLLYMQKILELFRDCTALPYRLAWFTSYIYFEVSNEEKVRFRNKFLYELDFFKTNRLDDMIARYAAMREITIKGDKERINVVTTISRFFNNAGSDREVDGFRIDYDINTWQGNRRSRFDDKSIEVFAISALEIQDTLNKDIL